MKKILILLITVVLCNLTVFSQNSNCSGAAPFCSGSTTYPAGVSAGTAQAGPNYGCLFSQPNPAWFFMQVSTSGNITLTIHPVPARDVDFILYGPFTSPSTPCASQLTAANTEDCSYAGGTADEYADITGGIAGEYYLLLITNYSNAATTVSFSQTGGSGSTSCAVLCNISSLTATPTACTPATNTYSVSGQVAFTTEPTTGTLTVSSSCGGSQVFNAPFTSPINYTINGITSNGAACNVTAVFSATPSCTRTQAYTSPPNCTPCIANAINNGPICSGGNLNLNASVVVGATSYHWTGPNSFNSTLQNPVIAGASTLASGTYTLTVTTPSATCTATTVVTINQTPAAPAPTNNGPICSGSSLDFNTAAVAGATYNWTGPNGFIASTQSPSIPGATNLATGTYSLTISANGCTSPIGSTTAVVNNTPATPVPSINGSTTPAAICAGSTITLTSNNIGGASYSWTGPNGFTASVRNPAALTSATPAMGGTYSLTVTVSGCTSPVATVSIIVNPIPAAPTAADTSICSNTAATLTATAPGGTYDWYDAAAGGTLLFSGASYTTPALTATTTYFVQSTMSGCTGPRTPVTANVSASFTVVTIPDDSICSGASFTLGLTTPSSGTFTYNWDAPGSPSFSASTSPVVTPATTTTYTLTVTNSIGCTGSDVITISVGTPLVLNAAGLPANCSGSCDGQGGVLASGSFAPYTYSWSTSATTPTVGSLCVGTYSVTVTDVIGCSALDTIQIQEPAAIALTSSSTTSHCNQPDGSATVNASGGVAPYTYLWMPGSQSTATATNLTPNTYTVTVTDAHGCTATTTVIVTNIPGVNASLVGTTAITCNASCDGTATVTASSGVPPYTYLWNNGQTTPTAASLCAGNYVCTVTDSAGCTDTVMITLTQPSTINIDVVPAVTICTGQSTSLTASATGGNPGGYTYNWMAPAFTGNPYTVSPTANTTYTVSATDPMGCPSANTQTVTVTVRIPLSIVASNDEAICPGSSIGLSAVASGGRSTSYSYNWMPGGMTTSSVSVSPSTTTTYTVTLTDGCTTLAATDVVTVTVSPLPNMSFSSDVTSGCAPLCVKFSDNSTIASGSITGHSWSVDGTILYGANPIHCFGTGNVYNVTLTDTSNQGCINTQTINSMITVYDMPIAAFTYNPQPASINYPEITFTDQSINTTGWQWNFADSALNAGTNTSIAMDPTHTYSDVGTYCVQLIATNTPACADTTTNCLVITPDFTIYIPNAFTPDGNGLNEEFYAKGENISQFEMLIYDRWGNLIFRADDINKHWKGTTNGNSTPVPMGVYVYIINLKDKIGEKHQYIGHVTVIR
ncbi:MAG: hypothetical protein JWP12_2810 [Bacteroidetes bacterium]|nr:hypothetical protein [Bacteroidota bacterium]